MQRSSRKVSLDDFEVNQQLMVLHSQRCRRGDGDFGTDPRVQGAVITVKAMNLPFVLVAASCPIRGNADLILDSRNHEFVLVSEEFAEAVKQSAEASDTEDVE